MRKVLSILLITAFTLVAADATGTWTGTLIPDGGGGDGDEALVILKQTGDTITGTAGPNENQRYEIIEGKVAGDKITFQTATGSMTMKFDLTLKGDELTGNIAAQRDGESRTGKLSLKRSK